MRHLHMHFVIYCKNRKQNLDYGLVKIASSLSRQVTVAKWPRCSIYREMTNQKVPLPSKLISLSECQLQQENNHIRKTVVDEVTTSGIGKKRQCQYEYSVKERVDIGKYSTEVLQLPYLQPLATRTH